MGEWLHVSSPSNYQNGRDTIVPLVSSRNICRGAWRTRQGGRHSTPIEGRQATCLAVVLHKISVWVDQIIDDGVINQVILGIVCCRFAAIHSVRLGRPFHLFITSCQPNHSWVEVCARITPNSRLLLAK
jgi:hypothetical protein